MLSSDIASLIEEKIQLQVNRTLFQADILTPVSCYLKMRDVFPCSVLLESSDYHASENSYSFICFDRMYTLEVKDYKAKLSSKDDVLLEDILDGKEIVKMVDDFNSMFCFNCADHPGGIFGYTSFDAVKYFDKVTVQQERLYEIPDIFYSFYRYIIRIDHHTDTAELFEFNPASQTTTIDKILSILHNKIPVVFPFHATGKPESTTTENEFLLMVESAVDHCKRGDVFQCVLSRRFIHNYSGDDFMLYRALRSVSPSPYLFYFDFGSFRMMGASPETQLRIKNGRAEIHPIAGTVKRTGVDPSDRIRAEELLADPKENSEHIMLVDLARNDLNKNCRNVQVELLREAHFYSHVIHLVSRVTGDLKQGESLSGIAASVFPAGTLSGAPKIKALELISRYEKHSRDFYGGAIGFFCNNGTYNHAITIRSLVSIEGEIHYQAGAGIVADSLPVNELNEIYNKVGSVQQAIRTANKMKV